MTLEKEAPFEPAKLEQERAEEKGTIFTVRLNDEEKEVLEDAKRILEQEKDSTALKQLAMLGYIVIHDGLTGKVLQFLFKNKRNNRRLGIVEFE